MCQTKLSVAFCGALLGIFSEASGAATEARAATASAEATPAEAAQVESKEDAGEALSEVVVTATKRDEVLKDVPIAISVFNAESITNKNITRPTDFIQLTPNVNLNAAIGPGQANVSIRGIQGNFNLTQPVAIVIDGVVQANPAAIDQELFGIQQIEVVKGPQGALFGRNANAGAIVITTVKPSKDFSASFVAGTGNGGQYKGQATVSGSLIPDTLYGRIGISATGRAGFWQDFAIGHPLDSRSDRIADGRLIYEPNDRLSVDLRARDSKFVGNIGNFDAQIDPKFAPALNMHFDNNNYFPPYQQNVGAPQTQHRVDTSLKVDYRMPFATLTGIASYDHYETTQPADGALNPLFLTNPAAFLAANPPLLPAYSYSTLDGSAYGENFSFDETAELRLVSPSSQRFRWMLGGYFANSQKETYGDRRIDKGNGVIQIPFTLNDVWLLDPAGPNPITAISTDDLARSKDYAAFGQIQYDLLAKLEAEVSLRWDEELKEDTNLTPNFVNPYTGVNLVTDPVHAPSGLDRRRTFTSIQPKYTLRYRPMEELTFYGSYGRGFRSGGFNPAGTGYQVQQQLPTSNFPDEYPSETSDAFELGFKSEWLDRRLTLNGAVFYTNIFNAQAFTAFPNPPITLVISERKVRSRGVELEIVGRLTGDLSLSESFGRTDATIRASVLPDVVGNKVPGTPTFQNVLGLDYTPHVGKVGLIGHLDWQLNGPMWFDDYNTPGTRRDTFGLVNGRLGASVDRNNGDTWQAALWVKNMLNKYWNLYSAPVPGVANYSYRADPRAYGVEVSYKF